MSIGENVKALRQRKGLTQSQLAKASGMQLTQVSRIENDDTDAKASTLNKIIQGLGCSANDIFDKPSGSKMSLEDFIESIDYRTGMDMKTAVVLWKQLNDHELFIQQVSDTYKNEPNPQEELIRKMFRDQGLNPDAEIEKLKASNN
tara:strand:- start:856 stop:1293 length:438 start_codon:yes stop_codon:yes gene_type:complete